MPARKLIHALLLAFAATLLPASAFQLPASSEQCLLGLADDWNSSTVTLCLYEKSGSAWKPVAPPWQARLGKNGLVWGRGLHPIPSGITTKLEGDMRSPAGVFSIGGAWGNAVSIAKNPKLSYRRVTSRDLWVEDPSSPKYNQNVVLDHEPSTPWEKKQQMKQNDPAHALKLYIGHNSAPQAVPGAGSSIFFHIWRGGGSKPSAGCTTMEETKLRSLISSINPERQPLYVLLPKSEYAKFRSAWKLP